MDWLANNWDQIMTLINAIGLVVVGSRKRK